MERRGHARHGASVSPFEILRQPYSPKVELPSKEHHRPPADQGDRGFPIHEVAAVEEPRQRGRQKPLQRNEGRRRRRKPASRAAPQTPPRAATGVWRPS